MNKKLLVTGFGGFVAGSVISQAIRSWEVHALSLDEIQIERENLYRYCFDLRETDYLQELFRKVQPDAVIHTAAIADIDYCESHQDVAEAVNVAVTREVARLCHDNGAKLIFCSTDTVFDGKKGLYVEQDLPCPLNFYAETKVRAECIIREETGNGVVTRLSLVMGLPVMGAGNSFLAKMVEKLKAGQEVGFPENEIRTPIDVITLGRALMELAGNDFTGTVHLSGNDRLSRFDMAQRIAERLNYPRELVVATNSNAIPERVPRPGDVSLDNSKAQRVLDTPMCTLMDGLELILTTK